MISSWDEVRSISFGFRPCGFKNVVVLSVILHPPGIYLFKVNNGNTGTICEFYSKLTLIKTPGFDSTCYDSFCDSRQDFDFPQLNSLLS